MLKVGTEAPPDCRSERHTNFFPVLHDREPYFTPPPINITQPQHTDLFRSDAVLVKHLDHCIIATTNGGGPVDVRQDAINVGIAYSTWHFRQCERTDGGDSIG